MKKKKRDFIPQSPIQKQLLSTFFSGFYLTHKDIVTIGKKIGLDLPYKKRAMILQDLFIEAEKLGKKKEVLLEFIKLTDFYIDIFKGFLVNYPNSAEVVNSWIQKVNSTKALLQREMAGNPYE